MDEKMAAAHKRRSSRPESYGNPRGFGYEYTVLKPVALKNEANELLANLVPKQKISVSKLWVLGPNQVLAQVTAPQKGLVPVATWQGEALITRSDQGGGAVPEEHLSVPQQPRPPPPRAYPQNNYYRRAPPNQMYRNPPQRVPNNQIPLPLAPIQHPGAPVQRRMVRPRTASDPRADPRRYSLPTMPGARTWSTPLRQPPQAIGGTLGGQPMLIGVGPTDRNYGFEQPRGGRPWDMTPQPRIRPARPRTGSLLAGQFGLGLPAHQLAALQALGAVQGGPGPAPPPQRMAYPPNQALPLRLAPEQPYVPPAHHQPQNAPPMRPIPIARPPPQKPIPRRRALSAAALPTSRTMTRGGRPGIRDAESVEQREQTPEWLRNALAKSDSTSRGDHADDNVLNKRRASSEVNPGKVRRKSFIQRLVGVFRSGEKEEEVKIAEQALYNPVVQVGSREEVPHTHTNRAPIERVSSRQHEKQPGRQEEAKPAAPDKPTPQRTEPMTEAERRRDAFEKGKEWRYDPERWVLVSALCHALERMCYISKHRKKRRPPTLTKFHADTIPQIPLAAYLKRIAWFSECSKACFVLTLEYIHRLKRYKQDIELNAHAVHQLVITCIMVSAKFFDDKFFNNSFYARVGGLPAAVISGLELQLLFFLNFDLHVLPEQYEARYQAMVLDNKGDSAVKIGPEGHWKTAVGADFDNYPPKIPSPSPTPEPEPDMEQPGRPLDDEQQDGDEEVEEDQNEDSATNRQPGADDESADAGSDAPPAKAVEANEGEEKANAELDDGRVQPGGGETHPEEADGDDMPNGRKKSEEMADTPNEDVVASDNQNVPSRSDEEPLEGRNEASASVK